MLKQYRSFTRHLKTAKEILKLKIRCLVLLCLKVLTNGVGGYFSVRCEGSSFVVVVAAQVKILLFLNSKRSR